MWMKTEDHRQDGAQPREGLFTGSEEGDARPEPVMKGPSAQTRVHRDRAGSSHHEASERVQMQRRR